MTGFVILGLIVPAFLGLDLVLWSKVRRSRNEAESEGGSRSDL